MHKSIKNKAKKVALKTMRGTAEEVPTELKIFKVECLH